MWRFRQTVVTPFVPNSGNMLQVWEIATGQCLRTSISQVSEVISLAYSPDGRFALAGAYACYGSTNDLLRVWDVATGRCLRSFKGPPSGVNCVAYSPDGRFALSGGFDGTLLLWDVSLVTERRFMSPWVYSMVATANEALERERCHKAHLLAARTELHRGHYGEALVLIRHARSVQGFEKSQESLELQARVGKHVRVGSYRGGWLKRTFEGQMGGVNAVAFSPDGRFALAGCVAVTLKLWDVATGECLSPFEECEDLGGDVYALAYSPDGRLVVAGIYGGDLQLWATPAGELLRTFEGYAAEVRAIAFSPDGRFVLAAGGTMPLRIWDVATGRCLTTFEGSPVQVTSVAYSPDGRFALSGEWDTTLKDTTVRLWEVVARKCLRTFEGHTRHVHAVSFSPDGHFALSASADTTLRLWDVRTGKCLRIFEGHTGEVNTVSFSPNGRFALSGSADTTLRLWDVVSGNCLRTFEGHTGQVTLLLSRRTVASLFPGAMTGTLRIWEFDWEWEFREPPTGTKVRGPTFEAFLELHTPHAAAPPSDRQPSESEVRIAPTRRGTPTWDDQEFEKLIGQLQCAGYGWLRPEGIRAKLEELKAARSKESGR